MMGGERIQILMDDAISNEDCRKDRKDNIEKYSSGKPVEDLTQ